ncbi:MAG: hypothetical protein KF898_03060 [Parachlamydiales bacterium]|nr:hypothetical protein [Candidatus Acheromyda pituitae]
MNLRSDEWVKRPWTRTGQQMAAKLPTSSQPRQLHLLFTEKVRRTF